MTSPIEFVDEGLMGEVDSVTDPIEVTPSLENPYPAPILDLSEDQLNKFSIWVRRWIEELTSEFSAKRAEWAEQEKTYKAASQGPKSFPFEGACGDVVPVMAMAVDPVHARLDTGIFKADPPFTVKALRKDLAHLMPSLTRFLDYYQRHRLQLRKVASPRFLEMIKHGTCVFKTIYDRETYSVMTYDADWKPHKKEVIRFSGPRVIGISIGNFMFPAGYENLQSCPIVLERQRVTLNHLSVLEASKKITNVDKIRAHPRNEKTVLEMERERSANQIEGVKDNEDYYYPFEGWCDFDIDGDGIPERIAFTYDYDSDTFLQLRYNWYFHQQKPYTLIPYTITNESLHGIGLGEMTKVFQEAITQWHQMSTDNAYLANIRMFIAAKDAQIEDKPRLYAARVIRVNDPQKDLVPFKVSDTYNSTIQERQNLFGLAEKRSGISDYLTGRESPIVGSRATATSTLALIDEGTKRVEQVMENIRGGMAEIMENCIYIWNQYGLDDIDNIVFGDDKVAADVREFFNLVRHDNIKGAIAISLTATDAKQNRAARQQVHMALIQTMMNYYKQYVELATNAIQAQQTAPAISAMMEDVATSARKMFRDLLSQYEDVIDPDDYLPDLEQLLENARTAAGPGGPEGQVPPPAGPTGVPTGPGPATGVPPGFPGSAPQGTGSSPLVPFAGQNLGLPPGVGGS